MEFLNQNKQNQRNAERSVILFYTLYTINLCFGMFHRGVAAWIPGAMIALAAACWILFIEKYRTFRIRAAITTVSMQLTIILYAANTQDLRTVVSMFIVLTVVVALYGLARLLWLTWASIFFIIFYYAVITDTFAAASGGTLMSLLPQTGNILCIELVLHIWLKHRDETTEQIYKIIDALIEAEQSKDDFLANVSHEIRTPVNTICGMSEMALREHDLDKMREEVFDIRDAGHNLMSLVSDILDFSQLQQGKMDMEEEAYNITSTVNDVINTAMARKGDKPIELIVDCDPNIPCALLGDEKKIRRVIMNLVDNAIKFTSEGGVIIGVHARREDYGVNLQVSVKDTGSGITEDNLEKLFESFSQVDTRRNRQEGGIGLGLAISKELVQKMGGTITVKSRLGKGSIFRFVIPQKVLDKNPIGHVNNRQGMNIATYFDMEQFDMITIRDEYSKLILHMVQQLQVKCYPCRNLADLKRRESRNPFTHIFISIEEYQEDEDYFDALAGRAKVIIVVERYNEKYIHNQDIIRLYKPFYILPVISILNGSKGSEGGMQMVRQGKFTAPDAHVLVVDDNRMNIRVVEGLLKQYRIKVTYAVSGRDALELIERMCYDFVFMDHMMPEMDGIETLHHIREKVGHYYQKVPVIALTANAAPGSREMFLEEGFDDFVAKPLEVSVLERVLRRNLPEEKLIFQTEKEDGTDGAPASQAQNRQERARHENIYHEGNQETDTLVIGDLDVKQALLYCGGRQAYLDILEQCCEGAGEERRILDDLYEKQDWKNYTIKVHAMKSTMRSIGAAALSEMAKGLEKAGKQGNAAYILANHAELIAEHCRVMEELAQCPLIHPSLPKQAFMPKQAIMPEQGLQPEQAFLSEPPILPEQVSLPELDEETFDKLLTEMEDAAYALDSEQMFEIISKIETYQYCQTPLAGTLDAVKKKVGMSDFMSAADTASKIRESLRSKKEGGAAE